MTREEFDALSETQQAAALAKLETEAPALPEPLVLSGNPDTHHKVLEITSSGHLVLRIDGAGGTLRPTLSDLAAWVREAQTALGQEEACCDVPCYVKRVNGDRAQMLYEIHLTLGLPDTPGDQQARKLEAIRALQTERDELRSDLAAIDEALELSSPPAGYPSHDRQTYRLRTLRHMRNDRDRYLVARDELRGEVARLREPASADATPAYPAPNGGHWCEYCNEAVANHTRWARRTTGCDARWRCESCWCEWAEAELSRLRARVAELEDGLRPFATHWSRLYGVGGGVNDSDVLVAERSGDEPCNLRATVADLRCASDLLGKPEAEPVPEADEGPRPEITTAHLSPKVRAEWLAEQAADAEAQEPPPGCDEIVLYRSEDCMDEVSVYRRPEYGAQLYVHGIEGSFQLTDEMLDKLQEWRQASKPEPAPDLPPAWEEALCRANEVRTRLLRCGTYWLQWYGPGLATWDLGEGEAYGCRKCLATGNEAKSLVAALEAALAACPQAREATTEQ